MPKTIEKSTRSLKEKSQPALNYHHRALDALLQVTLDLINRHELSEILDRLLIQSVDLLEAPSVSIDLLEGNDVIVTYAATPNQPLEVGDKMRRGEGGFLSWQAVDTRKPAILDDYSKWMKRRALYNNFPIHAVLIIPIVHGEQTIGTINFLRFEEGKIFTEAEVHIAEQLAQMAALVLDNSQMYTQLKSKLSESIQKEEILHEAQAQVIEQQRTMAMFDERQRMARDLHDSVNQSIHSLVLFSETLVSMLDKNNVDSARQISERLQESARQALKETRLLLYQTQDLG